MISRPFLATAIAALLAVIATGAHAQAAPVNMPAIPPHNCVKPEFPGKLASSTRISAFNKDYSAYGECIKKYVDDTKSMVNAAVAAGNGAVDEFNKFAAEIKAQNEAAKN
jgi:hypothetical protein